MSSYNMPKRGSQFLMCMMKVYARMEGRIDRIGVFAYSLPFVIFFLSFMTFTFGCLSAFLNGCRIHSYSCQKLEGWNGFPIIQSIHKFCRPGNSLTGLPGRSCLSIQSISKHWLSEISLSFQSSIGPVKKEDRKASVYLALRYTLQVQILYLSKAFIIQA